MLSLMGVSGFFGVRNIRGLRLEIVPAEEIYAGSPSYIMFRIYNDKRVTPSFLISVTAGGATALFPIIGTKASAATGISITFPARGLHAFGSLEISSVFPFNFFRRFRQLDSDIKLIVLPASVPCSMDLFNTEEKRARGEVSLDRTGFDSDVLSIRDYRYGDPQKYIHWKASARTGKLKTKELSVMAQRPVLIDFDALKIPDIERRISCTAFMVNRCFRMSVPLGMKMGGRLIKPPDGIMHQAALRATRMNILRELALYGQDDK